MDHSGFCVGWCMAQIKPPVAAAAEPIAGPPVKKRKSAGGGRSSKGGKPATTAKAATHELAWTEKVFEVATSAQADVKVLLKFPRLVPVAAAKDTTLGAELCRHTYQWPKDLVDRMKKVKTDGRATCFAVL